MRNKNEIKLGATAQKVLVLLLGGIVLGLNRSPGRYFRILKTIKKDWDNINKYALHRSIKKLYQSKLIDAKNNPDGSITMILTERGKKKALTYKIDDIRILPMKKWDKKWRVVLFDIPERQRKARVALQRALKNMGFYQFQKSVFANPFECQNEIDFVIEFFSLRPHVRHILADRIDNELHLKKYFELI